MYFLNDKSKSFGEMQSAKWKKKEDLTFPRLDLDADSNEQRNKSVICHSNLFLNLC